MHALLLLAPLCRAAPPPPADLPSLPRPLPHGARARPAPRTPAPADGWDVQAYDIDVDIDPDARTVEGRTRLTAAASGAPPDHLVLHADGPELLSVEVDGAPVAWTHEGDEVRIPTTPGGAEVTVEVRYRVSGDDTMGGYLGLDWGDPLVSFHEPEGARHWLVVRDVPWDKATLQWHTTLPEGWDVVQNGLLVDQQTEDGRTTWTWLLDAPIPPYLMVLHAGSFDAWTDPEAALPVEVHAAPQLLDQAVADLSDTADILAFFSGLWGEYPWPVYRNVVVPFGGGMEHTTATTFGEELLGSSSAALINAHEAAHHWWGDWLTCESWDEIWLNEGFASHAELRWYEQLYGEEGRAAYFAWQRESYLAWKGYEGVFSLYDPNFMWGGTVYDKGALVLEMLRGLLGADAFDQALRAYGQAHAHGAVGTADLVAAVEESTGQDWSWYFDQWVYQADDPVLEVGLHQRAVAGGVQVDLHARQVNEAGTWRLPLQWRLEGAAGTVDPELWVEEGDASLTLCLDAPVDEATPDPDTRLLHGGITREDAAFAELPLTCGAPSAADEGTPVYPLGCGGCQGAPGGPAAWLVLPLGALPLVARRRRLRS